jgi:hypothetical protein
MTKRKPIPKTRYHRYARPTVIVLGDGPTEQAYIDRLKELDYFSNVHLKFETGNEENFETKLKEHTNNPHVLVIIDVDNVQSGNKRFEEIKRLSSTKAYIKNIYFNNYSFETWLLNHKMYYARPITNPIHYNSDMFTCFNVESWYTNKSIQNRQKIVALISMSEINLATQNIKSMNQKSPFNNPSSNMDKWVEHIKTIRK